MGSSAVRDINCRSCFSDYYFNYDIKGCIKGKYQQMRNIWERRAGFANKDGER